MVNDIKTVAILGSGGTVGSLTGGIIAQEGIKVYFLSRTKEAAMNGMLKVLCAFSKAGCARPWCQRTRPAAIRSAGARSRPASAWAVYGSGHCTAFIARTTLPTTC